MGVQVGGGTGDGSAHHHVKGHPLGLVPALGRLSGLGTCRHAGRWQLFSMEALNGAAQQRLGSKPTLLLHVIEQPVSKGCTQS